MKGIKRRVFWLLVAGLLLLALAGCGEVLEESEIQHATIWQSTTETDVTPTQPAVVEEEVQQTE